MQGLRARLLVLLLSVTAAVLGIGLHSTLKIERAAEERARQTAMELAKAVSANQEQQFERAYQTLATISRLPLLRHKDPAACKKAIGPYKEPLYANLGVVNETGNLLCSYIPVAKSNDLARQAWLKRAVASGEFVIGDFARDPATEKPLLYLAYPITEPPGGARGAIFAALDLAWAQRLAASRMPRDARLSLIDDRGRVLVGPPGTVRAIDGQRSHLQGVLQDARGGVLEIPGSDRFPRLVAFSPVRAPDEEKKFFVGLETASTAPASTVKRTATEIALGSTILVLLVTTLAWLAGDFFVVRGFHSLLAATAGLASGDLSVRSGLKHGRGELGQLARAFDHLAESLERREREARASFEQMRAQRERQSALQEINLAITSTLELAAILATLLEKLDLLLPYSAATVQLYDPASGRLEPIASRNVDEKAWKRLQKEIPSQTGLGLPQVVFASQSPLVVADAQTDPRTMDPVFFRTHGFVSYLGVPLTAKGETLGVLSFYTKREHRFGSQEIDFLSALAGQAAIAIHNSQLFIRIKNQALELEKSNRIKSEFLAVMSHELRTPLNIIMNYTDLVRGGMLGALTDEQVNALGKVSRQSRALLRMIDEILEVTKLEAGILPVEKSELSVADLFFGLQSEYGALDKDIRLEWRIDPGIPPLRSDGVKLKRILNHLIDNAIKFTERGQVVVSAGRAPAHSAVEFSVRDTGIGIAEDMIPSIFEKFRQLDSSDSRCYGGIGLGLYLARAYTQMLGGTMAVQSRLGAGACFTVLIPAGAAKDDPDRGEKPPVGSPALPARGSVAVPARDGETLH
ncbi:MAG TPA: ATP-binding protein [Candidatus Acidoferrales bacterium]|nr:ATP-binding protein [Candidatus Acidoferrales bacterium]